MALDTKMIPNGSPNDPRISKKSKLVLSTPVWGTRLEFGSVLGALWSPFGTFWASLGSHLGSLLDMFGLFRASFGHHLRTDWQVAKFVPAH